MGLYQTIEAEMRRSLKEGDSLKLSVLRMLISAIKVSEIDKKIKALDEADILQLIQKQIKQRKESIAQFEKGNRQDLADKEKKELKILEAYMPEQMSEEAIVAVIKGVMAESGVTAKAEAGKVMKLAMEKLRGKADGKLVNQLVMGLLK